VRASLGFAAITMAIASQVGAKPLAEAFQPNAPVCVKFEADGHVVGALVNGSAADQAQNAEMLKLLQSRKWEPPPPNWVGKWVALSVNPAGGPVPEILPSCPAS
jgi:hypothetical protein